MKKALPIVLLLFLAACSASAQQPDSVHVFVKSGIESKELLDLFRFEGIGYYKISVQGEQVKNSHYLIVAKEYWNKNVTKTDTLINSRRMGGKLKTENFEFTLISKQTRPDTLKVQLFTPSFSVLKNHQITKRNNYGSLNPSNGKPVKYNRYHTFTLFAYSLPYEDPQNPNILHYCELSKDGVPVEQWGEKFNIAHYITLGFKWQMQLLCCLKFETVHLAIESRIASLGAR